MRITRTSMFTGKQRSMDLPVTPEQLAAFERGELIQRAMPNLTEDQREFILSGATPDEWDEFMSEDDAENVVDDDEIAF